MGHKDMSQYFTMIIRAFIILDELSLWVMSKKLYSINGNLATIVFQLRQINKDVLMSLDINVLFVVDNVLDNRFIVM